MEHSAARLRAPITALMIAAVVVLAGCASSHPASTGKPGGHSSSNSAPAGVTVTKIRTFAPRDRSGAPTAGVGAHRSGSCFTTSITVSGRGAYRCLAGNAILDPCFVRPDHTRRSARVLDCYASPWSRATELRVHSLPRPAAAVRITRPWAIELAGGIRCVVTNGTPSVLRGIALGYDCGAGSAGLETASGSTQHALYRAEDGLVRVPVVVVSWRAHVG